jgi:hypothetical protein
MVAHNPKMPANMGFPSGGEANQGWKLYLASLIMVLSAGLTVIARVVARLQSFKLKIDDYTIIASLVSHQRRGRKTTSFSQHQVTKLLGFLHSFISRHSARRGPWLWQTCSRSVQTRVAD